MKEVSEEYAAFAKERAKEVMAQGEDVHFANLTREWIARCAERRYTYHFEWLGRPAIQLPQDMVAFQEIVWRVRPDLIIETGIAHGGSLILSASMLALLDVCDAIATNTPFDPARSRRRVLGIDIDIRKHNREAIEAHPLSSRIDMIEGSSLDPDVVASARAAASRHKCVLVCLDSNHTHDHVLGELEAYAELATVGSYCIVYDTIVEDLPESLFADRPWAPGNSPKTAVWEFLRSHHGFEIDRSVTDQLMITVCPDGFLKRVSC